MAKTKSIRKKDGMKFSLFYMLAALGPAFIAIVVVTVASVLMISGELKDTIWEQLRVAAHQVNEYFSYDVVNNGKVNYDEYSDHVYIESLKKLDVDMTLFEGDTRLITSLKKPDGSYNEGSQADPTIFANVKAGNEVTADKVKIGNDLYFVCYEPIYDANGNFWGMAFAGKPYRYYTKALMPMVSLVVFISVVLLVIVVVLVLLTGAGISKALIHTSGNLHTMADGDLNVSFNEHTMIAEFNEIISSCDKLQENLNEIIGKTKDISGSLSSGAEHVSRLAGNSREGAEQIAQAMEGLSNGATTMAENVQNVNAQIVQMGDSIENITHGAESLVTISTGIKDANNDATDYINKVSASSKESVQAVNDISTQISETNTAVDRIKEAVDMISSIASQTNLLALNASIEAARAGEAGRGFAVVAGEIGSLAEQTNKSTEDIKNIVSEIVDKSAKSVTLSEDVAKIIDEEQKYIEETQERFQILNEKIEEAFTEINDISSKAEDLDIAKDSITASISDLGAISEENAASNAEVSESISDIANAIRDIASNSEATQDSAADLDETVAYFR
ncbi:MAG: cache domain-containing protein [Lachnospiraceae bacterium]|nr:cache domain-containing protein [Lachnospiraceae bacterium]